MTLTSKDLFATFFVGAALLLGVSVVEGWGWPLMNGVRMGIIALLVVGAVACAVSGWATPETKYTSPFVIAAILVGVGMLAAAIIGLFANAMIYLEIVMGGLAALWLITTVDRMLGGTPVGRHTTAA